MRGYQILDKVQRQDSNPEPLSSWTTPITIRSEELYSLITLNIILINLIKIIVILWCVSLTHATCN